jgi:hypothetical protein
MPRTDASKSQLLLEGPTAVTHFFADHLIILSDPDRS